MRDRAQAKAAADAAQRAAAASSKPISNREALISQLFLEVRAACLLLAAHTLCVGRVVVGSERLSMPGASLPSLVSGRWRRACA